MLSPGDFNKDFGSYVNLKKRVFQRVQSSGINDKILDIARQACEEAIKAEGVVLARVEKKRLQTQVLKLILDEMSKGLENS